MPLQTSSKTFDNYDVYLNGPKSRRFQDKITMCDDWHSEWATASYDPLPSSLNHLCLLNQPAKINIKRHEKKARTILLVHYDVNLVPQGRAAQDLRREHEMEERRLKKHAEDFVIFMERASKRQEVVMAARVAEVIDLTEDEIINEQALQRFPVHPMTTRFQRVNTQPYFTMLPPAAGFHQHPTAPFTIERSPRLVGAPWRASAEAASRRPQPQNFHKPREDTTNFTQNSSFHEVPAYLAPHEFAKPPALNAPAGYQVTRCRPSMGIWPSGCDFGTASGDA